ncbi:glycosyltransferase family protein 47 isoform X2 [Wolffia australiana]
MKKLRWRWKQTLRSISRSSIAQYFAGSAVFVSVVGIVFFWLVISSFQRYDSGAVGCQPDGEGSWAIGIYYGKDPFSLLPIELADKNNDNASAWPVANPVLSCASVTDAGFPSNFVADPFLFREGDALYLFFETKTISTMQGDIGVAQSTNNGISWEVLGIALDEEWHLSFPFVFKHDGQIYMMPEGNKKGDLRLYRATHFPLKWTLEKVLIKQPLVDAVMIHHGAYFWIFASDFTRRHVEKNAELEIWYSESPLGTWRQHKRNPIYRSGKALGARNGGRPFFHGGHLYRPGQDCGATYGADLRFFRVNVLTPLDFHESPVNLSLGLALKARNSWDGARRHHLDPLQLGPDSWVAVMDGDRVPSGESSRRFLLGCLSLALLALVLAAIPVSWRRRKRLRLVLLALGAALACTAGHFFLSGDGAEPGHRLGSQLSQFTLVTMTYEARLWNLRLFVKHYSRCTSVREIVVVWNKGPLPDPAGFDSAVPVRIRVELENSLNNRFKPDPEIRTRGVFQLDDDIMMTCTDVEKGFVAWRQSPHRIVGFYPRLLEGEYRDERYARRRGGYNVVLTGAAFMDSAAFGRYWSEAAEVGRRLVGQHFNCEDILMNFLYANASGGERTVEYVRPNWAIDTSKFSSAAISRNTQAHYQIRTRCLAEFTQFYGPLPEKVGFGQRVDRWDS